MLYQVGYQEILRKPVELQDKGYILVNQLVQLIIHVVIMCQAVTQESRESYIIFSCCVVQR